MGLRKCPRCELNYITEDEQLCHVCCGVKVKQHEELRIMCSECGENPIFKDTGLCLECYKDKRRQEWLEQMASGMGENTLLDSMCCLQDISVPLEEKDIESLQGNGTDPEEEND